MALSSDVFFTFSNLGNLGCFLGEFFRGSNYQRHRYFRQLSDGYDTSRKGASVAVWDRGDNSRS